MRLALLLITGSIALGALALPAWIISRPFPKADPTEREIASLQVVADESCRCTRKHGTEAGRTACWAVYEKRLAQHQVERWSFACGVANPSRDCFDNDCRRRVSIDTSIDGLCSNIERETVEAIWDREFHGVESDEEYDKANQRANLIAARARAAFRLGRKVAVPRTAPGGAGC